VGTLRNLGLTESQLTNLIRIAFGALLPPTPEKLFCNLNYKIKAELAATDLDDVPRT
jgi:hypothetical protein